MEIGVLSMTLGEKIQRLREERKLSRNKLARLADLTYSTIYNIEEGKRGGDLSSIQAIARALEAP